MMPTIDQRTRRSPRTLAAAVRSRARKLVSAPPLGPDGVLTRAGMSSTVEAEEWALDQPAIRGINSADRPRFLKTPCRGYRKGGSGAAPFTKVFLVYALWAIVLLELIQSCALFGYSTRRSTATMIAISTGTMSKRETAIWLTIW